MRNYHITLFSSEKLLTNRWTLSENLTHTKHAGSAGRVCKDLSNQKNLSGGGREVRASAAIRSRVVKNNSTPTEVWLFENESDPQMQNNSSKRFKVFWFSAFKQRNLVIGVSLGS